MADISQIKLPNGDTFDLVDEKSGYLTEETDPVFSASAAAGISATNITSWNEKIDKQFMGYIDNNVLYYPIGHTFGSDGSTWTFPFVLKTAGAYVNNNTPVRAINSTNNYTTLGSIYLDGQRQTGNVYLNLAKLYICRLNDGSTHIYTVATLSDIPTIPTNVSSFTNDSGYLTLSTLPIYDGTVV